MLDLVAHDADEAFDAVRFFSALWDLIRVFRGEALRRVLAGDDDRLGRRPQPRAGNDPLVDRVAKTDVGIPGAFRAEVAGAREAGEQLRARDLGTEGAGYADVGL